MSEPIRNGTSLPVRRGEPVMELIGVTKHYGNTVALSDINLTIRAGEVVGLVGDNGSGKSTLVKIAAGYHQPSQGKVRFAGKEVRFRSPADARARGVEVVYQDLALIDDLSLWRNFFLKRERCIGFGPIRILRKSEMKATCRRRLDELGLVHIRSTEQLASALSGGEKQSVAITRAVHFGAALLLLDEPTAALSVRETNNVFRVIERAKNQGLGVVYIDHRLDHVTPVADRIVVLEHGQIVAMLDAGEKSVDELRAMVSRSERAQSLPAGNLD